MFKNCTLLQELPESLNNSIAAQACYENTFNGCINLTSTPKIMCKNFYSYCYSGMFSNCPNITNITLLCTNINVEGIFNQMFDDNIKYIKGTFTKYEGVNLDDLIPVGWTVRELSQETGEVVNEYVKHLNN